MSITHGADSLPPADCVCKTGPSLGILKEVQRVYEERLELIERNTGENQMQLKVDTLKAWVCDLVSQNALLTRVVEELESEATARLLFERKRHAERRIGESRICDSSNEFKILNDTLQIENIAKEREIRRLHKETQQYEHTISNLRKELSQIRYHTPREMRDAEAMVGMCCTGQDCAKEMVPNRESGDVNDVTLYGGVPTAPCASECRSKVSVGNVRALREDNVALSKEVSALKQICVALHHRCETAYAYAQFRDEIIREMRRQLKYTKNKLSHLKDSRLCDFTARSTGTSQDSASTMSRRPPRALRHAHEQLQNDHDDASAQNGGGDDVINDQID